MKIDERKKDWIWLNMVRNNGLKRITGIIREYGTAGKYFASRPRGEVKDIDINKELDLIEKHSIRVIAHYESAYPENLKRIYSPPPVLYVKGDFCEEDLYSVAIVGTRRPSYYGMENAERFGYGLAARGYTVVSGLARGVDTMAHRGALKAGGRTVAVLGCGLADIYPDENKELAARISENGAVVSEFSMSEPPIRFNFPRRNRVISGLSLGVLVIEAGEKSGALITANFALHENREVFSLPGMINSPNSKGTLRLIKEGAKLVEDVDDIVEEIEKTGTPKCLDRAARKYEHALSEEERLVFDNLSEMPAHIDDIMQGTSMEIGSLSNVLLKLQCRKIVKEIPGKMFVRSS